MLAPRCGLVDLPDGARKRHARATPLMGGVAITLSWLVVAQDVSPDGLGWPLIATVLLSCLTGLWDDFSRLKPATKLYLTAIAAAPWALSAASVTDFTFGGSTWPLGACGWVLAWAWLVACSHVINLMDGLDGLAATVTGVIALAVAVAASILHDETTVLLAVVLAGCQFGFLLHNRAPAKIFMGDAGSLTCGCLLGMLTWRLCVAPAGQLAVGPLVLLVAIPIFDTLMAITRRTLTGRSIAEADRQHLHHTLRDRGLTVPECVLSIGGLVAVSGFGGVASLLSGHSWLAWPLCGGLWAMLIAGRIFGHVEWSLVVLRSEPWTAPIARLVYADWPATDAPEMELAQPAGPDTAGGRYR